ncbi:MAG: TlpA family protein disulfide reductase [Rhizobiales bacterium]|nr:TlpA family protein disulfide reductase [Hyphomicrobiales bacterium]
MNGKPQRLGQWERRLLVLNFWATWCAPCKEEMPMLGEYQKRYAANGLQIVGIAADTRDNVAAFQRTADIGYPLLPADAAGLEFSRRLGNRLGLLPFTVVYRPGGELVFTRLGLVKSEDMQAIVDKYLPNMPK